MAANTAPSIQPDADVLADLRRRYGQLLQRLLPDRPRFPSQQEIRTRPTHNGDAHVEVVDGRLHYVVTERGAELHRRVAGDDDELLYWLMDDVVAGISHHGRSSLLQRVLGRDPRRRMFAMHLRLLDRVHPAWAARKKAHYADLLRRYPFRDRRTRIWP